MLDIPSLAVTAGVVIWLSCFLLVGDPFASPGPDMRLVMEHPPGSRSSEAETVTQPGFSTEGESFLSALFWGHPATMNITSNASLPEGSVPASANFSVAASNWFDVNANGSNILRAGAQRLRQAKRRKQEELRKKGQQVQSASIALASAIRQGRVQKWVVVGAVAAFFACGAALQLLSSARGTLRQAVRRAIARSLPVKLGPNELVTRPYSTWAELTVRVSLDFLNEPANLMLVSIGSLQVLATWSKADPWRCKKINLLVLLLNFAYTLVQEVRAQWLAAKHDETWNSTVCTRINSGEEDIKSKDISVGDIVRLRHGDLCPATGELISASHSFVLFNSLCETGEDCCSILSVGDLALRGFVLALESAEVLVRVTETRNGDGESGAAGAPARPSGNRPVPPKSRRMERFPEHMNRPLMQANLASLTLLFCASTLACALSYRGASQSSSLAQKTPGSQELSQSERLLLTHFFSAAVQFNTVIPSMRWVVLFFLYIFLVEAARPDVRVQNWRAFQGLKHRRILYSDKTGTLTEVGMHVARLRLVDTGTDLPSMAGSPLQPSPSASWGSRPVSDVVCAAAEGDSEAVSRLAAILLACNDCQQRPQQKFAEGSSPSGAAYLGLRPGTSPEEIAVAEHLELVLGLVIETNPLQPGASSPASSSSSPAHSRPLAMEALPPLAVHDWPLVLRDMATGREVARVLVLERSNFDPAAGCREARVAFASSPSDAWIVRQGGADLMADLAGKAEREAELAAEDRDRALGWAIARLGADGARAGAWHYVLRASFSNPPRKTSAALVSHCRLAGVAVRVLTGDASVAALHISREIGVFGTPARTADASCPFSAPDCICHEPREAALAYAARLHARLATVSKDKGLCIAVPGAILREQIEAGCDDWLADERASAVIYRTRAADKALIVRRTEEMGRARQLKAAVKSGKASSRQSSCIGWKFAEVGVCMMMGDAANDAEAISLENVIGISLRHGAAPCRLGADFVVDVPGSLIAIRTELRGRALAGARWLLSDVCQLCGMIAALTFLGVWAASFAFLPRGFLYDDPYDARIMTIFSGMLYPFSACAAACTVGGGVSLRPDEEMPVALGPVRSLLLGLLQGCVLGLAGPSDDIVRFGRWILGTTSSTAFLRHTLAPLACIVPFSCLMRPWQLLKCGRQFSKSRTSVELGEPNWAAQILSKVASPRSRLCATVVYVLITWL